MCLRIIIRVKNLKTVINILYTEYIDISVAYLIK